MSQPDVDLADVGWVSDSVTQQVQEQSPKYSSNTVMSGYATLTRPTMRADIWGEVKFSDVISSITNGIGGKQSKDRVGILTSVGFF